MMGNLEFVGDIVDPVELANKQIVRLTLERAALRIERENGNKVYMSAWKTAAKIIREMKPD